MDITDEMKNLHCIEVDGSVQFRILLERRLARVTGIDAASSTYF